MSSRTSLDSPNKTCNTCVLSFQEMKNRLVTIIIKRKLQIPSCKWEGLHLPHIKIKSSHDMFLMKRGCHVMVNMKSGERCGNTKEHKTYKWLTERLFFKMCKWNPLTCKWVFVLFHKNNNNIVPLRKCTNGIIHRSSILIILDLSSTSHEMKWAKHFFSKKAWSTTSYLYWQLVVVTIDGFLFFCLCFLYIYTSESSSVHCK
jgi:hypothetical protein